jgi:hypothetical protein
VSSGPAVGRRLSRGEYVNTLETTLGVTVDPAQYDLRRDARVPEGLRNGAVDQLLSPNRVEA